MSENFKPKDGPTKFTEVLVINRKSPEYKLGLAQLEEWHARCRAKRLGIKRKPKDVKTIYAVLRSRARKAVAK